MCGIAGLVNYDQSIEQVTSALEVMRDTLRHRGPDAQGIWVSSHGKLGFAHTRLAILDLSEAGAQPMECLDTGSVLVYNGEIYNYVELRRYLESLGITGWRGTSDTEVLLALLVREGVSGLRRVDGMFAFGFFDARRNTLTLGRDHLGEKPLYYARHNGQLVGFASETRALVRANLGGHSFDYQGLSLLMRKGSITPPHTQYEDIRLLKPGHTIVVDLATGSWSESAYWRHPFHDALGAPRSKTVSQNQIETLKSVIRESFSRRMRSDVPVGAFLSGGVDSSFVCARLIEAGIKDLHTFTVVMPGQPGDESIQARKISQRLGTVHHEIPLVLDQSLSWLEGALDAMDVPSVDGPNTWLVSGAVANEGFKVACSGLGGDELFYGYPSFRLAGQLDRVLPAVSGFSSITRPVTHWLSSRVREPRLGRVMGALTEGADWAALWMMRRGIFNERELGEFLSEPVPSGGETYAREALVESDGLHRQTSALELQLYMHDQLLRDTDAMSMAHSLEVRVPLIGRKVVEEVAALPPEWISSGSAKWFLKDWLAEDGFEGYFEGPKQGFTLNWNDIWERYLKTTLRPKSPGLHAKRVEAEHSAFMAGRHHYARSFVLEMACRQTLSVR